MMMKTMNIGTLMIAALVAAVMMGCSSNNLVEEFKVDEYAIDFTSNTKKSTKAVVTGNKDLANAGGFYVWGWKTATPQSVLDDETVGADPVWTDDAFLVFEKVRVYSSGNNGEYIDGASTNWTYDTKKYWDRKSSYCFYAAGPVSDKISLVKNSYDSKVNDMVYKIVGVTSSRSDAQEYNDFVIHRRADVNDVKHGKSAYLNNVDFTFHHVMSKVALKIQSGINSGTIVVTDITMSGWDPGQYTFTQHMPSPVNNTLNKEEWNTPDENTNSSGSAIYLSNPDESKETTSSVLSVAPNATVDVPVYWIMVPQTIGKNKLSFRVCYRIEYQEDGTKDYFVSTGVMSTSQTWGTDCQTTYTLKINPRAIQFNVESVNWTNTWDQPVTIKQ